MNSRLAIHRGEEAKVKSFTGLAFCLLTHQDDQVVIVAADRATLELAVRKYGITGPIDWDRVYPVRISQHTELAPNT